MMERNVMPKNRLEAFSDGVLAIVITIMVLELKVPHGKSELVDLLPIWPIFLGYLLSFIYVAIYWNNHHHLLQVVKQVNGPILWANMHLLFWLSLLPFATSWMGDNPMAQMPVALYGFILLMAGLAYYILTKTLLSHHGDQSELARAIGNDFKGKISIIVYAFALPISFFYPLLAIIAYFLVALLWLVPDKRMEKVLKS